ncbi:hypothetical protein EYF80_013496 [Liparis tanakae]|uniref:Uncharacterized protein n=1 Tax=Liparis tanakae TaxID=230148 RepID=A0A4Z2IDX2_9TELE|nr:hypothetical protein EYF80_013496 [Liparis tanakae]
MRRPPTKVASGAKPHMQRVDFIPKKPDSHGVRVLVHTDVLVSVMWPRRALKLSTITEQWIQTARDQRARAPTVVLVHDHDYESELNSGGATPPLKVAVAAPPAALPRLTVSFTRPPSSSRRSVSADC